MNINSPEVIAYARKNGCSDLEAWRDLRKITPISNSRAVSTVFAHNPDLITVTRR